MSRVIGVPALLEGEGPTAKRERTPKAKASAPVVPPAARPKRGLWFATPAPAVAPASTDSEATEESKQAPSKPKRPRHKNDPKLIAAAREFRDRYLEQVNGEGGEGGRLLPSNGKYDVSRQLAGAQAAAYYAPQLLEAA